MKNKPLFQFSLTAICSMVLVACGSNGGSSNPTTQATNTTPETNAPTTEPATIPATTPTTTSEVANATSNETTDKQKLMAEASATPFIGYKHVSKTNSRFVINETEGGDNGADTPVGMNIQNPNRSFDTLVVAEPVLQEEGKPAKIGYLEDFDFRKDQVNYVSTEANGDADNDIKAGGVMTFQNKGFMFGGIYVAENTVFEGDAPEDPFSGVARNEENGDTSVAGIGNTKTSSRGGNETYTALVYDGVDQEKHDAVDNADDHNKAENIKLQNYTDTHFTPQTMASVERKTDGSVKYNADGTVNIDAETSVAVGILSRSQLNRVGGYRTAEAQDTQAEKDDADEGKNAVHLDDTTNVAEVYGYRTFASPEQYTGTVTDVKANNLPLENKQLTKVQYGRVTSHLAEHTSFNDFKKGVLQTPAIESYVVDYGGFGADGTEDHYFYRGVDGITSAQLSDLQAKGGILKYWGHAVSYGLNNKWDGSEVSAGAPTAIGANSNARFVSGNHAHAWVNMANGDVGGAIYNTWVVPTENDPTKGNLKAVNMVEFEGKLAANGNIAGTSKLAYDPSSTGVFGANLYGSQAQEMGGVVASHDKMPYKKWGAVFGAIRTSSSEIQNATNRGL